MKTSTSKVIVIARLLGTLGVIFSLLTFCTNCWLLATETCTQSENITGVDFKQRVQIALKQNPTPILKQVSDVPHNRSEHDGPPKGHIQRRSIAETMKKIKHFPGSYNLFNKVSGKTFHYEGFFWSCTMDVRHVEDSFSTYVFFEQAPSKSCIEAYHLPFPTRLNLNSSAYDSAAGILSTFSIIMYSFWIQALVAVVDQIAEPPKSCPHPNLKVQFGWSFMAAPVGIVFSLLAGLLFIHFGCVAQNKKKNIGYSLPLDKIGNEDL
ncbi:transmembrane protein 182-like isoform X2 [Chiloscyllium plagiosum]|uniref:transmembrane protein 182-like isoform X2 n=1 Tax=Chiloscyllium plagiosum TaxID=36176 RepID=UPI001CB869C8|nr:transmembrane protein 182-like isoform X2 [Chiloscyllium plagiosum]